MKFDVKDKDIPDRYYDLRNAVTLGDTMKAYVTLLADDIRDEADAYTPSIPSEDLDAVRLFALLRLFRESSARVLGFPGRRSLRTSEVALDMLTAQFPGVPAEDTPETIAFMKRISDEGVQAALADAIAQGDRFQQGVTIWVSVMLSHIGQLADPHSRRETIECLNAVLDPLVWHEREDLPLVKEAPGGLLTHKLLDPWFPLDPRPRVLHLSPPEPKAAPSGQPRRRTPGTRKR